LTKSITLFSTAGGYADLIVLPSAFHHAVSPSGCVYSGGTWSLIDGTTVNSSIVSTDPAALAAVLSNYRIVGYGLRVFSDASMSATSGRLTTATLPISSYINDKTAKVGGQATTQTSALGSKANTLAAYGVPWNGTRIDPGALMMMANATEVSMQQLATAPISITPKITSPEAFVFNQCSDSAVGFDTVSQTSATYILTGDGSYMRLSGQEAVVIAVTGAATSTNVLQVDLVYHLEGNPAPVASGLVSASADVSVAPLQWMETIKQAAHLPGVRSGIEAVGNSIIPGLGTLVNRVVS